MSEIRDGFFYNPYGMAPAEQVRRLIVGEHNLAFDDLFSITVSEVADEIKDVESTRKKLLQQLSTLRKKLLRLRAQRDEIKQAVQTFAETGEIDPVLIPACQAMAAREQAALRAEDVPTKDAEIATAKAALTEKLPDGWSVMETTADDEFVYVTVRCKRAVVAPERLDREETRTRMVDRVREAFENYARDFMNRPQPLRLSAVPANPRASP